MNDRNNSIPPTSTGNFDDHRPRLQIIRGLPGCGKTTLAKQYPCMHLEFDHYCYRSGAYRWGESRDRAGEEWLQVLVHRMMREGIDLVVSGVYPEHRRRLGWLIYWAMKSGYEVWVQDLTEIKGNGNVHGVRMEDQDRFSRMFQPFVTDEMAHVSRFGRAKDEVRMSENEALAFEQFVSDHVHVGLMPMEYPNEPEMDGLGV